MNFRRLAPWLAAAALGASGLLLVCAGFASYASAGYEESSVALDKVGDNALDVPIYKLVESGVIDLDKALADAGHAGEAPAENQRLRLRGLNRYLFAEVMRQEAKGLRQQAMWCAALAAVNFLGCFSLAASLRHRTLSQ